MAFFPTKAEWVDGKKGQGNILLDQQGFRMRLKKKEGKRKYYICPRKVDLNCPVAISLDIDTDMIVRVSNEHNHENDLVD